MNRMYLISLTASVGIVMSAWACNSKRDLLIGGGFEQQSELQKSPADWFATEVPETKEFVRFEWDDRIAHTGERSVSIAIDVSHPDNMIAYNWTKVVPACKVGKAYELSGWVKTENLGEPIWLLAQCWNEARDNMLGFATTQKDYPIKGTSDWTRVGTVFTVPEGTAEVRVRAGVATRENRGGKGWFDDIQIVEVR